MRKVPILIVLICSNVFIANSHKAKVSVTKKKPEPVARWKGTIKWDSKITYSNFVQEGTAESHAEVFFTVALPTMNREDGSTDLNFTDDKGTGSFTAHNDITSYPQTPVKKRCVNDCSGSGDAELHTVIVREWDNTYDIEVITPLCHGTDCEGKPFQDQITISVSNETFTNKDVLTGTRTRTGELAAGFGTFTNTTTWHFERVKEDDVELIVTPQKYDTWLPEPGKDELTKGTMMTVDLKLQGINGKPLKAKVESFELTLNNTSTEPGITINYPIEPDLNQLPDLRFLHLPMIESTEPDQFISVGSPDGINGKAYIGSYDGGGWTVLTVEAILVDKRRIKGRLLKPGGEIDIRIPKRDPNSHIGEAWLKKYKNPGEMDDIEKSKDNAYKGDGLTAYEEYRGVVSEGKFKRLDPTRKEVGIHSTQTEFSLFGEGIGWFKNASDLEIVRFDFDRDEIGPTQRLNNNAKTAHDFDQYVLFLINGGLGGTGTLGVVYTTSNVPDIPARVIGVVIDWRYVQRGYQNRVNSTLPEKLKFTVNEYLAQTVAHELGHAVNIWHHGGDDRYNDTTITDVSDMVRIFNRNGNLITDRPYSLKAIGFKTGTVEGGNLSCMLNYYPYYRWGYSYGVDKADIFNQEPLLPLGKIFCESKYGTLANATKLYFGDATRGNCIAQIKLRD